MQLIYKHKNKILVTIMVLMLIPFVFNIGLEIDEPFSMAIINHSYSSIASLTTMDVHPPLYYWALKAFLSVTTFWTSNIFIKIIFARFLSLIFSLVTLYYLIKILNILNLHYNKYLVSFIFFMCPLVYGREGIASGIRMYSLGAMFCAICFYYLLLFKNNDKLKYLPVICLSATFTLYTQYLIGMIAGLYILSILVILLINKKFNSFIKLLLTAIVSLVLYMPWIPKIIIQFSSQSIGKHAIIGTKYLIFYYGVITVLCLVIVLSEKINVNMEQKVILYINLLISLLILFINAKFNPYSISVRYTSIAMIMNYVMIGLILICYLNKNSLFKVLFVIFTLSLLYINVHIEIPLQKEAMIDPSIHFYREFNSIKRNNNSIVNARTSNLEGYSWNLQGGNAVYLKSINKKIEYDKSVKTPISVYYAVGNGNVKLFRSLFPNLKGYSTTPY